MTKAKAHRPCQRAGGDFSDFLKRWHAMQVLRARRDAGEETLMDIARSYNVSHSTISRL